MYYYDLRLSGKLWVSHHLLWHIQPAFRDTTLVSIKNNHKVFFLPSHNHSTPERKVETWIGGVILFYAYNDSLIFFYGKLSQTFNPDISLPFRALIPCVTKIPTRSKFRRIYHTSLRKDCVTCQICGQVLKTLHHLSHMRS